MSHKTISIHIMHLGNPTNSKTLIYTKPKPHNLIYGFHILQRHIPTKSSIRKLEKYDILQSSWHPTLECHTSHHNHHMNQWSNTQYNNLPLKYALWIGAIGVYLVDRCALYSNLKLWKQCELKKNHLSMTKSNLSRHLLNMKVWPTSKALKLYTTTREEPAVNYRWISWVWKITSWSSRLQENYWSF